MLIFPPSNMLRKMAAKEKLDKSSPTKHGRFPIPWQNPSTGLFHLIAYSFILSSDCNEFSLLEGCCRLFGAGITHSFHPSKSTLIGRGNVNIASRLSGKSVLASVRWGWHGPGRQKFVCTPMHFSLLAQLPNMNNHWSMILLWDSFCLLTFVEAVHFITVFHHQLDSSFLVMWCSLRGRTVLEN